MRHPTAGIGGARTQKKSRTQIQGLSILIFLSRHYAIVSSELLGTANAFEIRIDTGNTPSMIKATHSNSNPHRDCPPLKTVLENVHISIRRRLFVCIPMYIFKYTIIHRSRDITVDRPKTAGEKVLVFGGRLTIIVSPRGRVLSKSQSIGFCSNILRTDRRFSC
jgi:hypothetical protein